MRKGRSFFAFLLIFVLFPLTGFSADITGSVTVLGERDSRDAVVYIDAIPGVTFQPPAEPAIIDQVKKVYIPHVLPILKGTIVEFRNSDPEFHNVHGYEGKNTLFNVGMPLQGQRLKRQIDIDGEVLLLCDVHTEMEAFILFVPTPYFSKTKEDGSFKIEGVPAGSYTLLVWHENGSKDSKEISISEDKNLEINFSLKK